MKLKIKNAGVELRFGDGDIDFNRIHVGDKLWKTSDPELDRRLRQSFAGDMPKFQRPIHFEVHGGIGQPLILLGRDELGHTTKLESTMPLAPAEKQPLTTEKLRDQLGRLIRKYERELGSEINYTVMSYPEFKYRKDITDHFLYDILESKHLTLVNKL